MRVREGVAIFSNAVIQFSITNSNFPIKILIENRTSSNILLEEVFPIRTL